MDWIKNILFVIIIFQELQIILLNKRNMDLRQDVMVLNQMMARLIDKNLSEKILIEDKRTSAKNKETDK